MEIERLFLSGSGQWKTAQRSSSSDCVFRSSSYSTRGDGAWPGQASQAASIRRGRNFVVTAEKVRNRLAHFMFYFPRCFAKEEILMWCEYTCRKNGHLSRRTPPKTDTSRDCRYYRQDSCLLLQCPSKPMGLTIFRSEGQQIALNSKNWTSMIKVFSNSFVAASKQLFLYTGRHHGRLFFSDRGPFENDIATGRSIPTLSPSATVQSCWESWTAVDCWVRKNSAVDQWSMQHEPWIRENFFWRRFSGVRLGWPCSSCWSRIGLICKVQAVFLLKQIQKMFSMLSKPAW